MQTTIIYNGVTIRDVLTDNISHEPFLDSTGVDQIGVRVVVDCTGVIHASPNALTRGVQVGNLAAGLNDTVYRLQKNRRGFKMLIGGQPLYDVQPGAVEPGTPAGVATKFLNNMDLNHGPKPRVQVLSIKAGYSATIRFQVEFVVSICSGSPGEAHSGLVNFRFWIAEDIDCKSWLTTRTYSGRLRVAHKHFSPHLLARSIIAPPLQRGFKRDSIAMHESENGLELDFTIQDREIVAAPPWDPQAKVGASDWRGQFQISTTNGAVCESNLSFQLTGPKGTSKADLATIAMRVIEAKTHLAQGFADKQVFPKHFAISEELHANTIECSLRLLHTSKEQTLLGIFDLGGENEFGKPLQLQGGYDPDVAFHPGTSATLTGLFTSLLQTPCNTARMPQVRDQDPEPYEPKSTGGTQTQASQGSLPDYKGETLSPSHYQSAYLDYQIDSDLEADTGRAVFPTGAAITTQSVAVVNMHNPIAVRDIRIEARRVWTPPELPTPNVAFTDTNGILHRSIGVPKISAGAPELGADSRSLLYSSYMSLKYAMSRPPLIGEAVSVGAVPYRASGYQDASRRLPANIFVDPKKLFA